MCQTENISVISLYFLKSFDRVDWDFIFSALQKFRYDNKFIHIIKVAYTKVQFRITINCLLSDTFILMGDVRLAEVLANFIIVDTRIREIQIGDQEIKIVVVGIRFVSDK